MGCGCGDRNILEQYFGYQLQNSGTVDTLAAIAVEHTRPIYVPTNPFPVEMERGFNGYRYALDVRAYVPVFESDNYTGIFPVKEQPRISAPYPYQVGLVQ